MNFDKFAQLKDAIEAYGARMAISTKDDPHTKIAHLMCLELLRDLKAERDAASNFPGLVVRLDYAGKHMSACVSEGLMKVSLDPVVLVADAVRGVIAEVLRP